MATRATRWVVAETGKGHDMGGQHLGDRLDGCCAVERLRAGVAAVALALLLALGGIGTGGDADAGIGGTNYGASGDAVFTLPDPTLDE